MVDAEQIEYVLFDQTGTSGIHLCKSTKYPRTPLLLHLYPCPQTLVSERIICPESSPNRITVPDLEGVI